MDLMGNVIGKKIQERDIRSDHPKGCAELGLQLIILLEEQVAVPPTSWQCVNEWTFMFTFQKLIEILGD